MSPLDDELHDALHGRAATIAPPADPLRGIERRARGLRRRRVLAAIAGGAALIAAVAVAVPALLPDHSTSVLQPADQGDPTTPAPTPTASPGPTPTTLSGPPPNVLTSWPQRGASTRAPAVTDLLTAFARAMGRSADTKQARYRELFVGDTGKGEGFTVGQAWFEGDAKAFGVSYTTNVSPDGTSAFFVGPPTAANPVVLAFDVPNLPGMSDLLVVVPQPSTGQVLYDDNGAGAYRPITGQDQRDGVVLIDRSVNATDDRLELLDGNGDTSHPTFEGPVAPLLCGLKECG